jgi:uncharacterized protein with HEPN domain
VEKRFFSRERIVQDAVIRNLEIIGEATRNLSENLGARHPEIPWMRVAGLRDVLIHEYFGVQPERVWRVVERRLPELKQLVELSRCLRDDSA